MIADTHLDLLAVVRDELTHLEHVIVWESGAETADRPPGSEPLGASDRVVIRRGEQVELSQLQRSGRM